MSETDIKILQKYWADFKSYLVKDLNDLETECRKQNANVKTIERIEHIRKFSEDNTKYMLNHKEAFIRIDSSLEKVFSIIEAFDKMDNLDNPAVKDQISRVLNSNRLLSLINSNENRKAKIRGLEDDIEMLNGLISETNYDIKTLISYFEKHHIDEATQVPILMYVVRRASQKDSVKNNAKNNKNTVTKDIEEETKIVEVEPEEAIEVIEDPTPNYSEYFEEQKARYEAIRKESGHLLNKYYEILQVMSPATQEIYKEYCSISEEELKEIDLESNYDEALANIDAIRLLDIRTEIEKLMNTIVESNYSNKSDIDLLNEKISNYLDNAKSLQEIDKRIVKANKEKEKIEKKEEIFKNVFFLTDTMGEALISPEINENGYQKSLAGIINKVHSDTDHYGSDKKITELKVNKKLSKELGTTVYAIKNYKVMASFIVLHDLTNEEDGVMLLTASLSNPNTILTDTENALRENMEQLQRQIKLLEKRDPQQSGIQSQIYDEIMQYDNVNKLGEESEINGNKVR